MDEKNKENKSKDKEIEIETGNKENKLKKEKEGELFGALAESFYDYLLDNIYKYQNTNFYEIFTNFLNELDNKGKEIINELEKRLARKITFDDIKYLYLKTGHTLFEESIKEIFKKYGNTNFIKEITNQSLEKVKNFLIDKGFSNEADKLLELENKLKSFNFDKINSIENFYKTIRGNLKEIIKKLPNNIKSDLKNLKITNEEIIANLKEKGFLTEEEYNYIKGELKKITDDVIKKIDFEKISSLQSALLTSNIINVVDSIDNAFNRMNLDLRRIVDGLPISKLLDKTKIKLSITNLSEEIWNELDTNLQNLLKKCIGLPNEKDCIEKIVKDNFNKPSIKKFIIENLKNNLDSKNLILVNIIEKALNSDNVSSIALTDEEKSYLLSTLFEDYKENFLNKFIKEITGYIDLIPIVNEIFDFEKNKITLPNGKEIDIEKNINLTIDPNGDEKVIESFDKIFDLIPQLNLTLKGENINYLKNIFPEKFEIINGKTIYKDSLSKIKFKDGSEIIGSISKANLEEYPDMKCSKGVIEIYSSSGADLSSDSKPIKLVCEENIQDIETIDPKIELKGNNEVVKFIFGLRNIEIPESINNKINNIHNNNLTKKDKNLCNNQEKTDNLKLNSLKDLKKEWNKLEGDENANFEIGSIISVKGNILKIPGIKKNWYNLEIIDIDEKKGIWKIKPYGGLLNIEGGNKIYDIYLDSKIFKELKYLYDDAFYKFKKILSLNDFVNYIKEDFIPKFDVGTYDNALNKWKRKIDIKNNKLVDKEGNEIKYIGKVKDTSYNPNEKIKKGTFVDNFFDVFKIEIKNNYVNLIHPYDKKFNKKVDYNTFLMILLDNQLEPWTENEFKSNEQQYTSIAGTSPNKGGLNGWFYYSIGNLIFSFKEIANVAKQYFKDEDDFRAAELLAGISSHIPEWIPLIGDMAVEANAEKDAKIWKRINSAKDRLARADKGGNHAKIAAKIIEDEIFKPVLQGKNLSYRKKLRAAGYLLYALERGPGEYFRALAKYSGKGIWVKALFGEGHYQKWLLQNKELRRQLETNPTNENLRNKLVFSEIFYMKEISEADALYSSNFNATLEGTKINIYSGSKVQEVYEGEVNKGNYYAIYDAWKAYILSNRPPNSLGALKALTERVEEEEHYIDYYKVHLLMNLTGYVYSEYNTTLKESYEKICRTYGIPIGLYAGQYDGLKKTLKILDYIVKYKKIRPGGKKTLTEYLYEVKNPDKIHSLDLKEQHKRAKIIQKMEEFWGEYGDYIVKALDYRDPILLKKDIHHEEKELLDEYFETKVNDKINEDFAIDKNLFKTAYSPYYQLGILNLSKRGFSEVAGVSDGEFNSGAMGGNIWKALEKNLNKMADKVKENPKIFDLVFSKFKLRLISSHNPKNEISLLAALLSKNDIQLDTVLIDFMKDKYGNYLTGDIPDEMIDGLKAFKKVFKNTKIDDILEFLIKKDKDDKGYYTVEDVATVLSKYELLFSSEQIEKIKNKLKISNEVLEKALVKSNELEIDSTIYNWLENIGIDKEKDSEKFTLLFSLIKRILKKEVPINYLEKFKFISTDNKKKLKKFIKKHFDDLSKKFTSGVKDT